MLNVPGVGVRVQDMHRPGKLRVHGTAVDQVHGSCSAARLHDMGGGHILTLLLYVRTLTLYEGWSRLEGEIFTEVLCLAPKAFPSTGTLW